MNRPRHSPSSKDLYRNAARLVALCAILLVSATGNVDSAATGRVRRVLILHSFGRDFAPFSAVASHFRTELARQSPVPVEFFEASLETARITEGESERPFVEYLRALLANRKLDLVAPFGAPAAHFMQRYRARLFPGTPMLIGGMDQRRLRSDNLDANSTSVTMRLELSAIVENILRVLPGTKSIAVVLGNSPLEKFWLAELRREFQPFTDRVEFIWLNELSFAEMRKRLAALQPNSAILYGALVVDATGVPHQQERALQVLRAESNAPIFGAFDNQLGEGIVGGALIPIQKAGFETARVANGIMNGESAGSIRTPPLGPGTPVYDWRELKRWGISESRLPPNSIVRFRAPSVWKQYRWYIIGALTIILAQAMLIAGFIFQRARRRQAQAELGESELHLDLAASAAGLGLWLWNIVSDEIWATDKGRELFGFAASERIDFNRFMSALHPEDREAVRRAVMQSLDSGGDYETEYRAVLPDGKTRWFTARGRVELDGGGNPVRMRGVALDISRRKQAEERIRLVLEAAPNGMIMANQDGKIELVNATVEAIFGYARDELIGRPVEMLVPERVRGDHPAERHRYFADPRVRAMGAGRDLFGRRKDGSDVPVEIGLNPIHTSEGLFVMASIIDITERKQMEARLRQERGFLRQVIDIDPNFIFAKDREGRFTLVNQAVADAYGTTVEDLVGKTDADFNPNVEEVEFFRRKDLEVMNTLQEQFIAEEYITDSKGKVRWLQTVKRPIIGRDGAADQVLGLATDITQRRQAELEAARQRAELAHIARVSTMGELAASVAHELNQPLGAILSNAEAAEMFLNQEPPALGEVREILADIRKDDQRAGDVIQRMRALLRRREMEMEPLDINGLAQEVLKLVHADAALRKTKISLDLAPDLPPVKGDRVHLQQVLLNLILNGMEALAGALEKQRLLIVRTGPGDNGTVKIAVSDSGPGIPADKLPRLFEPFFTTKKEGLGMGLAISQTIVEAHGGLIWAEDNPERGATFSFTLPAV